MNDEKTTEIELPPPMASNIVRVNFTERRKIPRPPQSGPAFTAPARRIPAPPVRLDGEWKTPLWVRLVALLGILALSLFVL